MFRFPRTGGPVEAYHPDSLGSATWASLQKVPPIRRVLGADLDERMLWAVDADNSLIAVDLETGGVRKVLSGITYGTVAPDGSLYVTVGGRKLVRVVRRGQVAFHDSLPPPGPPRALFGAVNDQVIAITSGSPPRLIAANAEQTLHSTPLPAGQASATFWGDLVGVATDTAVVLYETGGRRQSTSIRSRHHPQRIGFSQSAHRLFVAQDDPEIQVFDRFTLRELEPIRLPGVSRDFRLDASGRWMLARPAAGDSVWVVDLATNRLAAAVPGEWGPDLPLVAGPSTLLVRLSDDVASYDLRQVPPARIARFPKGGADVWLAAAWVPRERVSAAAAAAESATVAQDSALLADSVRTSSDSTEIFLQVSASQNPDWAGALAKQLKEAGFPSRVLDPKAPYTEYRVLVGPYPSREGAEEAGRRLGRPYFVLRQPPRRP